MTEASPYETPNADLQIDSDPDQRFVLAAKPRSTSALRGWAWINQGFDYFRRSWAPWIGAILLGMVIMVVVSFIPFVNLLFELLTYQVWVAGIALGCRAQAEGQSFKVSHLWAGFRNRVGALVLLSLLYNIALYAILGATFLLLFPGLQNAEEMATIADNPEAITAAVTGVLIAFLLIVPVVMASLFAPHLIVFHELPLFAAIKLSFIGSIKNLLPFLFWFLGFLALYVLLMIVTGFLGGLLGLLVLIPMVLGLLVLVPTSFASIYIAYEEIYLENKRT
jgi:hypothetical protein